MNAAATDPLGIGYNIITAGTPASSNHPDFVIDDVLIYSDALLAAEVLRNYNAGKRSHR